MTEPFPIWITKWAIFKGIEEATAWEIPGTPSRCSVASGRHKNAILQAGEWHRTKSEAVAAANAELNAKIEYHRQRLEELESVVFIDGGEGERTDSNA